MIKSVNMNRNQRKYGFVICNLFFLISKKIINNKRKKYTGIRFNYFLLFNLFLNGTEQTRDYRLQNRNLNLRGRFWSCKSSYLNKLGKRPTDTPSKTRDYKEITNRLQIGRVSCAGRVVLTRRYVQYTTYPTLPGLAQRSINEKLPICIGHN
jgi:hypothetical protein